ncbi:uncharacterized protein LOC109713018 [Ananas comosus]|uniref:Uncharacterized protein LOC109713018 n=1 Tax=Ananas comosus TaxID=4615 RepID=A0A6P5FH26_ANACO|nr:uncharacterized protein LOC109713018 [Ananas comosus]
MKPSLLARHRLTLFREVMPGASSISISSLVIPSGNLQSKQYTRFASASSTIDTAKLIPGQILRPAPNGISSKSRPLKSKELPMNLSGRNSSGFAQDSGSRQIAQALMITLVLL